MRRIIFITVFLILLGMTTSTSLTQALTPQTQLILDPIAESWVSSAEPDTNFGGQGFIWAGYGKGSGDSTSTLRGLVQFDLSGIPAGATIIEARLYATIWKAQGPPDHFRYCPGRAVTAWNEASVTWNNKPTMAGGPPCTDISATSGQVSWDMTNTVQEMVAGLTNNHGFYLVRENDTSDPQEHTRQFAQLQLMVIYETITPTPTAIVAPSLILSMSDNPDPVDAGDEVVYTIQVRNEGNAPSANLVLQDTLPTGTSFVEASNGGVLNDDGSVSWEIASLAAGAEDAVQLVLRSDADLSDGAVLNNQAALRYPCPGAVLPGLIQICQQEVSETTTVRHPITPLLSPTPPTCP
ncbi:MAG: DUF11 domain-containing protein, partial [Chloroflexi bacterium]|nr:DUF11 domain-containing protein [Chloroflexota bacterium]